MSSDNPTRPAVQIPEPEEILRIAQAAKGFVHLLRHHWPARSQAEDVRDRGLLRMNGWANLALQANNVAQLLRPIRYPVTAGILVRDGSLVLSACDRLRAAFKSILGHLGWDVLLSGRVIDSVMTASRPENGSEPGEGCVMLRELEGDCPIDAAGLQALEQAADLLAAEVTNWQQVQPQSTKGEPAAGGSKRRRCYDRDQLWLEWKNAGAGNAAIRDRWNKECKQHGGDKIADGRAGADVVKIGVRKAREEREAAKN